MTFSKQNTIWILVIFLFAIGSIAIYHHVKIGMRQRGYGNVKQLGTISVGSPSPDFSASDLQGRSVVLSEFQDRKVVLLDFWATWCAPCVQTMPKNVEILAVNLGEGKV